MADAQTVLAANAEPLERPKVRLPAAIYARISRDREGAGLGVERQEADCRALAERMGWDVVAVFVDNDISAYSGAVRPQYRAMLDAIRAGEIRGVLAWHVDRLYRRLADLDELVTITQSNGLQIQTVTSGDVNLSTASGLMFARTLGNMAQYEVDHARDRMKRAKEQMALDGKYRGGPRPFGYEKDGTTIRKNEAAALREAMTGILAGRSLAGVAKDLNQSGVKTSTGSPWTYAQLKDVLVRPRNAGLLSRGDPTRPEGGGKRLKFEVIGRASWPGILTEAEWRAIYETLSDPSRRHQNGNDIRWLGSGIYVCSKCGGSMRPAPYGGTKQSASRSRRHLYRCTQQAHLTVSADKTDAFVLDVLVEMVRDPRVLAVIRPGDGALLATRERRTLLATRLDAFERDYALGVITGAQLQKATQSVTEELNEIDGRLTKALRRSTSSAVLAAADPGAALREAPVDVQRAVLATVLRVEVLPQERRGSAWTQERLQITAAATVEETTGEQPPVAASGRQRPPDASGKSAVAPVPTLAHRL